MSSAERNSSCTPASSIPPNSSSWAEVTRIPHHDGVTRHPEMWAAGVPIVPFVNWFTEFENEDPQLQEYTLFMGDRQGQSSVGRSLAD